MSIWEADLGGTHFAAPPRDVQLVQAACCCLARPGGQHQGRARCRAQAAQHRAPPAARCRCIWRTAATLAARTAVLSALVPARLTTALCRRNSVPCKQQSAGMFWAPHVLYACRWETASYPNVKWPRGASSRKTAMHPLSGLESCRVLRHTSRCRLPCAGTASCHSAATQMGAVSSEAAMRPEQKRVVVFGVQGHGAR